MNKIQFQNLLNHMEKVKLEASGIDQNQINSHSTSFTDMLSSAISELNSDQMQANQLATDYELGTNNVSIAEVMVSAQKANLEFQAAIQIRNKFVGAYQEIMNMAI